MMRNAKKVLVIGQFVINIVLGLISVVEKVKNDEK